MLEEERNIFENKKLVVYQSLHPFDLNEIVTCENRRTHVCEYENTSNNQGTNPSVLSTEQLTHPSGLKKMDTRVNKQSMHLYIFEKINA